MDQVETVYFERFTLDVTPDDAASGAHQGQCDGDVQALSERDYIARQLGNIDADGLKHELQAYGAWDDDELNDHDQNLQRILWLACCDINEGSN